MKYAEEYLLCCMGKCLVLSRINPPVQLRQNPTEFSVTIFFMKLHDLFSGSVPNHPNPFPTSKIIKIKSGPL